MYVPPIFQSIETLQSKEEFKRALNGVDGPTASPTESPAPSPSPSAVPTSDPATTASPTKDPTAPPTESPAPSPSPSKTPTGSPSAMPSSQPSSKPSVPPTATPSTSPTSRPSLKPSFLPSSIPSHQPTNLPSQAPSNAPSNSAAPSQQPSVIPSSLPSANPTLVLRNLQNKFLSSLRLEDKLSEGIQLDSFTGGVARYISTNQPETGTVSDIQVSVLQQTILEPSTEEGQRWLETNSIEVEYIVKANYAGTDPSFRLLTEYGAPFQDLDLDFIQMLVDTFDQYAEKMSQNETNIFETLLPPPSSLLGSNNNEGYDGGVSKTTKYVFIVVAVVAVGLAIFASVYAIRHYEVEKSINNLQSMPTKSRSAQDADEDVEVPIVDEIDDGIEAIEVTEHSNTIRVEELARGNSTIIRLGDASYIIDVSGASEMSETPVAMMLSRKNLEHMEEHDAKSEKEKIPVEGRRPRPRDPEAFQASKVVRPMLGSPRPPPPPPPPPKPHSLQHPEMELLQKAMLSPSSRLEVTDEKLGEYRSSTKPQNLRRKPSDPPTLDTVEIRVIKEVDESNDPTPRNRERNRAISDVTFSEAGRPSQSIQFAPSQLGRRDGGRVSTNIRERIAQFEKMSEGGSSSNSNNTKAKIALAERLGSTMTKNMGAGSDPQAGASDLTSQARAFITSMLLKAAPANEKTNQDTENQLHVGKEGKPTSHQINKKSEQQGRYDVFAPPGAIGIVVDTTKDGPCVHSLKTSSPMIGLITPGDLIVGLDGQDTSGMTAATVTRLMAQKSSQKERKISLLPVG
ncbi:hypothetical protein ACA910_022126 [Epithemia clementina (nom. ined.)]